MTGEATPVSPAPGAPPRLTRDEILSPRVKLIVAEKKAQTEMIARIAELNWGKGLVYEMRRVLAVYCRRNGLDPREINILGGNIYRNGKYWLRRLSELVQADHVEWVRLDHIAFDERLEEDARNEALPEEDRTAARAESVRRRQQRIRFRVPEAAASACLCRVKVKWLTEEIVGCKFIVIGRKKKTRDGFVTADPVGEEFPTETVETRAVRRALRQVASTNPALKSVEEELQEDEFSAGANLREIAAGEDAREAAIAAMSPKQIHPAPVTEIVQAQPRELVPLPSDPVYDRERELAFDRSLAEESGA